ncbi:prolyl 4-hydroxylase subunit alpha-1-like [Amblyomma americanum]
MASALRRHVEPCEATWHRAASVMPFLKLHTDYSLSYRNRPEEKPLLKLLRLSALDAISRVLLGSHCPQLLIEKANHLAWPTAEDLDGAAAGVCRLQKAYHISADQAAVTLRSPQLAELTSDDMISLAVHCALREPTLAIEWADLGEAERRYAYFFEHYLEELVTLSATAVSKTWWGVVGYPPETSAMWPYRDAVIGFARSSFTSDSSFGKLCHSSRERDARPTSSLRCWMSSGKHGAASLAPFAVEELSSLEPRVWLIHDFLNAAECAALRQLPEALVAAEVIVSNEQGEVQESRTAALGWLEKNANTANVYHRAEMATGLSMESAEKLQLLNYGVGGHYMQHMDPVDSWLVPFNGDRLATLLVYLSDVAEGGATAFPLVGLSITPRRGSALFWFNLKENATGHWQQDESTQHGSCPVLRGSKWIATIWIHERAQAPDFNYTLP